MKVKYNQINYFDDDEGLGGNLEPGTAGSFDASS